VKSALSQACVPASVSAASESSKQSRTTACACAVVHAIAGGSSPVGVNPLSAWGVQPVTGPVLEEPVVPLEPLEPVTLEELLEPCVTVDEELLPVLVQKFCCWIAVSVASQDVPSVTAALQADWAEASAPSVAQQAARAEQPAPPPELLLPPLDFDELSLPVPPELLELHAAPVMAAANKTGMTKRVRLRFMAGHLTSLRDRVKEIGVVSVTKSP
jgi:hypothetical protein